jgi:hypothetical protein
MCVAGGGCGAGVGVFRFDYRARRRELLDPFPAGRTFHFAAGRFQQFAGRADRSFKNLPQIDARFSFAAPCYW